MTLTLLETA